MRFPRHRQHSLAPLVVRYGNIFLPHGVAVSLEGASPRCRLARTLVETFLTTPGRALAPDALVAAAWPENPLDPLSRGKLKVTVCRLRAAGLPILTLRAGYAIDPRAIIVVADPPPAEPQRLRGGDDRFDPLPAFVG